MDSTKTDKNTIHNDSNITKKQPHSSVSNLIQTATHDAAEVWHAEERAREKIKNSNIYKFCEKSLADADRRLLGDHILARYAIGLTTGLFVGTRLMSKK